MNQYRQRSRYGAQFVNVSQNPLLSLPLLSDVGQNSGNAWHLISWCLQTLLGKTVCSKTCSTWPVTIGFLWIPAWLVSHAGCS